MPYRVIVVGAGFGGIGMAIALKQAGIEDFVVLDKADDLGGTWRDNSYPGLCCDVPSQLYSYSFRPGPRAGSRARLRLSGPAAAGPARSGASVVIMHPPGVPLSIRRSS